MDDRLMSEFQALIDRERKAAYDSGVIDGRMIERNAIREMIEAAPLQAPPPPKRRQRRAADNAAPHTDRVTPFVIGALRELEAQHPQGMFPDTIAVFLQSNPNGGGEGLDISVKDVRAALRQATLTGKVRRLARGKFLPIQKPPELPFNPAAE